MRILLSVVCLWSAFVFNAHAESDVQCPYEAVVDADDLYLRSGPGTKYYPTGKLQSGQRVMVRRLDPGGWLMIDPPEGTFSLIPAEVVERTGEKTGQVVEDQVKVVMGSEQTQGRAVTQCELNQGDTVEILGEKILSIGGPAETWYQIRPPQGEYRWVHGKYIVPVDGIDTAKHLQSERKKAETLRKHSGSEAASDEIDSSRQPQASNNHQPRIDKSGAVAQTGPDLDTLVAEREQLKAVDREWELMLERSPSQWKLDDMEQAYHALLDQLTVPVLKRQVDYRLQSLKAHRKVYEDFIEFQRITDATDRRDQELQEGFAAPIVQPVAHEHESPNEEIPHGAFPEASAVDEGLPPRDAFEEEPVEAQAGDNPNKFVLTGRLVRTAPAGNRMQSGNTPQFALVAPNNQVLAFVHSTPQVGDLTPFLNREVGINGSNWSRPGQQMNVYSVTQIAPLDGQAVRDSSTPQFAMPTQQPLPNQTLPGQPLPGQPLQAQPLMSQGSAAGNWQPQQQPYGTPINGTMSQPIPSQFQGNYPSGIQPVSGEQGQFPSTPGQGVTPIQGYPLEGENRAFSAYPPNQGMPQQNQFQYPSPDQFHGGVIQNQSAQPQTPNNVPIQQLEQIEQHFNQPSNPGQWQPSTQMQQPQGQAVQRGNVIHRPPQYSNQKRSWWPFGRKNQQTNQMSPLNPLP